MTELHDLTALEQGAAIRTGEVSSTELVDHYLQRVERWSETVGAFVTVTGDLARKQALLAAGSVGDASSPLYGVPTAIKDLHLTAGVRTEFGSATMGRLRPRTSPTRWWLRIEAAGLISLGKTTTPEFGSPCYTEPDNAPAAPDPVGPRADGRRLERWCGRGRRRRPGPDRAGHPTAAARSASPRRAAASSASSRARGRISGGPMYGDPVGLATAGPMARTVRDAAAFLDVMAGPAVGGPDLGAAAPLDVPRRLRRTPGRLRIGRFVTPLIAEPGRIPSASRPTSPRRGCWSRSGTTSRRSTYPSRRRRCRRSRPAGRCSPRCHRHPPGTEDRLRPLTRWLQERGAPCPARSSGWRWGELRRSPPGRSALAPYDAVLTPTLAQPPLRIGEIRDDADPARDFENQKAFTPWTSAWNLTGMPAVSLPLHVTPEGLPVGVMLGARPAEEHLLLALAAQVEAGGPLDRPKTEHVVTPTVTLPFAANEA